MYKAVCNYSPIALASAIDTFVYQGKKDFTIQELVRNCASYIGKDVIKEIKGCGMRGCTTGRIALESVITGHEYVFLCPNSQCKAKDQWVGWPEVTQPYNQWKLPYAYPEISEVYKNVNSFDEIMKIFNARHNKNIETVGDMFKKIDD